MAGTSAPAPTKLADEAGEHVANVAVKLGACPANVHATQREIGLTGSTWCVHVSNLQVGYAVTGTIATNDTSLTLTVNRKDGPLWALVWSFVALLAAVLLALLSRMYVPHLTSKLRRWWLYKRRDGRIGGLGAWVERAANNGVLADDDIVARAQWAQKYGPTRVTKMRVRLGEALPKADVALKKSLLYGACQEESEREDFTSKDVLNDDGTRSKKAADLVEALTKADRAIQDLRQQTDTIVRLSPDKKQKAEEVRDGALQQAENLSDEYVPQFEETLAGIAQSMWIAFVVQAPEPGLDHERAPAAISVMAPRVTVAGVTAVFVSVAAYLPAVLLALVTMAGVVAGIFSAQYLANAHFGTLTDYRVLLLSAYASAEAAAIAAAVLLMRSPPRWYG